MKLDKRIINILENNNWTVREVKKQDRECSVDIENISPAGESIVETVSFNGTGEDFVKSIVKLADDFDVDEHAELWIPSRGKNGVPVTIKEIIDDAYAIKDMFKNVSDELQELDFDDTNIKYFYYIWSDGYDATSVGIIKANTKRQAMKIADENIYRCDGDEIEVGLLNLNEEFTELFYG